ncbi:MAG: protein-tyrosine-phosphatase [Bacteroidota bacterium]
MLYPQLASQVAQLFAEPPLHAGSQAAAREAVLDKLKHQVQQAATGEAALALTFVCTHNSRRSHLAQIWASLGVAYFGYGQITAYSAGTEVTALNERVIVALEALGFRVERPEGDNPQYHIYFSDDHPPVLCWSKRFDDPSLPQTGFTAVMVCDHAEQNCPFIPGTKHRLALPFLDPKYSDGTAAEREAYQTAALTIGAEVLRVFNR